MRVQRFLTLCAGAFSICLRCIVLMYGDALMLGGVGVLLYGAHYGLPLYFVPGGTLVALGWYAEREHGGGRREGE